MTWKNITVGSNCDIIVTAAASSQSLDSARSLIEVYHKVEEVELSALFLVFKDSLCKNFILLENCRKFFFCECKFIWIAYYGFNGNLVKSLVIKGKNVLWEVEILLCESTSYIVLLIASAGNKLLVHRHNFIVASSTVNTDSEVVIDFLSSVDRKNNVWHFLVDEVNFVVVEEKSVCSNSEAELLVVFTLTASCVIYDLLDYLEIHKRFAAEEIKLKVRSVAGIFKEKINSVLTCFKWHQLASLAEIAGRRKAVLTAEIAVVSDIQTHCLYRRSYGILCIFLVIVIGEKNLFVVKLNDFLIAGFDILSWVVSWKLFDNFFTAFFIKWRFDIVKKIICKLVHNMNAAAVYVKNNIKSVKLVFMYHI